MSNFDELSLNLIKLSTNQLKEYREENQRMKKKMNLNRQIYFVNIILIEASIFNQTDSDNNIETHTDSETHFFNTSEDAHKFISKKEKFYEKNYEGIKIKKGVDDSGNVKLDMKYFDKTETYQDVIKVSIKLDVRYQCYDNEPFVKIENNF